MTAKETVKRYALFIISLFFSAMGVAVTKRGELGVSPISSVPNVISEVPGALSLGTLLIIWNTVLLLGQIVLLRRNFKAVQLLQLPLSVVFGVFTDLGMRIAAFIPAESYAARLFSVAAGTVILAFGISLAVTANVVMNSGEAFVKAVSDITGKNFGNLKVAFDVLCVALSVVLSLLLFKGKIVGTREGTLIAAVFTGLSVKAFVKITGKLERFLKA